MSGEKMKVDTTTHIGNEADINGNRPSDKSETGTGRRQFLKRTVGAGITAGLGHFLLIGRNPKQAKADQDLCLPPYTPAAGDECLGYENADICFPPQGAGVDDCQLSGDWDKCDTSTGVEVDDQCSVTKANDSGDACDLYPHTVAAGDNCGPEPGYVGDVPDWP